MIDIWVKLVSNQFELALNLTRAAFGLGERETPVSVHIDPATAMVPDQADAVAATPMDEPQKTGREEERLAAAVPVAKTGTPGKAAPISAGGAGVIPGRRIKSKTGGVQAEAATIPGIMSFLQSASGGATVREVAEHLEMDKKKILPFLKKLVKEGRIDELLGRYCVLKA